MTSPAEALPTIADDDIQSLLQSLGLPKATSIAPAKVTAEYHSIYFITVPESAKSLDHAELVLRVSGRHIPVIKTRNEIGVMSWLAKNTTIPIPDVIANDDSEDNPINHEYTLLSKAKGVTLSSIFDDIDDDQAIIILDQLIDILNQLHSHPWPGIGGITLNSSGDPVLSQVLDENFWQLPDIAKFWPGHTITELNIQGPYDSYVDFISAQVKHYIRLVSLHPKLEFMLDLIPRLEAFIEVLPSHSAELNNVALRLAHKDLHFANILLDPETNKITAILDWEFSGVVPFTKWNPSKSFLWNGRYDEDSTEHKRRWMSMYKSRCRERGCEALLKDAEYQSPLQDDMQLVVDYLRAIVEVSPRGQRAELVGGWRREVVGGLEKFGV
ncbi:kinase-like domain-containing protein [Podospora aff. communis PSN243]|uniref:Kinase-like domain-containing protein n=1 Tax=Podospora aff. communis PSN243 TaxID=3040156 RepID=A0AAV9GMB7_9PEZI|nr:kinase-like domain-containing protein [Podospora aff. communis PSN243]